MNFSTVAIILLSWSINTVDARIGGKKDIDTPNDDTSAKIDPLEQPSNIPSKVGLTHKVNKLYFIVYQLSIGFDRI